MVNGTSLILMYIIIMMSKVIYTTMILIQIKSAFHIPPSLDKQHLMSYFPVPIRTVRAKTSRGVSFVRNVVVLWRCLDQPHRYHLSLALFRCNRLAIHMLFRGQSRLVLWWTNRCKKMIFLLEKRDVPSLHLDSVARLSFPSHSGYQIIIRPPFTLGLDLSRSNSSRSIVNLLLSPVPSCMIVKWESSKRKETLLPISLNSSRHLKGKRHRCYQRLRSITSWKQRCYCGNW